MKLKSTKKVVQLTEVQEKNYLKRKKLAEEIGKMRRRITELEQDRNKLDTKLVLAFEKYGNRRSLSDGTIVERLLIESPDQIVTKDMVGSVIRSAYSYPKYKEIAE